MACWTSLFLIPKLLFSTTRHSRSFHRLDPRYQILTYFNDLALEGVEKLESMGGVMLDDQQHQTPLILRVFIRAGVFSVWRPTSKFAIQKMITGEGVGKGLDIKGKSALKGKYSGFVPFVSRRCVQCLPSPLPSPTLCSKR